MTTRTYNRIWCKTCNEFELHEPATIFEKELHCIECSTVYTDVFLSKIPSEKLKLQRKRYKEAKSKGMMGIYQSFILGYGLHNIGYNSGFDEPKILESDAGQKEIDEIKAMERELKREKRRIQRQEDLELKQSFHKLGRNDKCLCGSGKKYKKCCYSKIQKI